MSPRSPRNSSWGAADAPHYAGGVTPELAAVLALLLAAVGVVGILLPVLPGSLTVGAGLLVWALFGGSSWGWVTFGGGAVILAVGATAVLALAFVSLFALIL